MSGHVTSTIALAKEDLAVAGKLIAGHPRHAAFNMEQAAEKLLKAALLPEDHLWRADLMAFDDFTSYATAMRYPRPGGGMPHEPEDADLRAGWAAVSALVDEIEDWCKDRR